MGGTRPNDSGSFGVLKTRIDDIIRRLAVLERPSGTSVSSLVAQVQLALANISTAITVALASGFTTTGDVTIGGKIRNVTAYSNPITTSFRAVWVTSVDGQFGFNLSSREFKQDIENFFVDLDAVRKLRLVSFRYIEAVENQGNEAETHVGLIAEEVHDLGLGWLVEYENGKPYGIKFYLLGMALLAIEQAQDSQLSDHEDRIKKLESRA